MASSAQRLMYMYVCVSPYILENSSTVCEHKKKTYKKAILYCVQNIIHHMYLPTPPHEQVSTQGQLLRGV